MLLIQRPTLLLAAAWFLCLSTAVNAADLTTVTITNVSGSQQDDTAVTFGQVFKQGDVPDVATLGARIGSTPVDLQVDAKAYHADGSLRHAILTAAITDTINAGGNRQLVLSNSGSQADGADLTIADIPAAFDAIINIGGSSISAKNLLAGAEDRTWLSGPLVSEFHVSSQIGSDAHLMAYFHVRVYADGRVWVDCIVENGWTQVSNPGTKIYTATITVGGDVDDLGSLSHPHHSRWHKAYWWPDDPGLYGLHDHEYLQATQAVPNYKDISASNDLLNSLIDNWAPLENGNLRVDFGATGASDSIGPLALWDALYLTTGDFRALRAVLINGSAGGSYSIHYRDKDTQYPFEIDNGPNVGINDGGSLPSPSGGNPYAHDQAHQPSIAYLAYLTTGDYFYLEEMHFWSSWNLMYTNSGQRNGADGWFGLQVRGQAWAMRNLGQAAYITPDDHTLKAYFVEKLGNNIARYEQLYSDNPGANALGVLIAYYNGTSNDYQEFRPWMDDFFTWAMGYIVELGFTQATEMAQWKAQFPKGRMGITSAEYCYNLAPQYNYVAGTGNDAYWPDFRSLYEANIDSSITGLECGSQAIANAINEDGHSLQPGQITGRAQLYDSYYANMQPALAMAVDLGVADLAVEWARWIGEGQANPVTPDYDNDGPTWAIEPRALRGPTINFSASAFNVDPGSSAELSWSTSNAVSCTASGAWSGSKDLNGSETVTPGSSSVYTLRCLDDEDNGSTRSVTVLVGGIPVGGGDGGDGDGDDEPNPLGGDDGGGSIGLWLLLVLSLYCVLWRRRDTELRVMSRD